jgi:biphenyl 2,3-dioxygenase beta subunit
VVTNNVKDRMETQFALEQFYYDEAALLDSRDYTSWIQLFTDDTHYWMPIRRTVTSNDLSKEFTAKGEMAFFDDDKALLESRVRKLDTGYAWSEDPPSRTRHLVTNVRVVRDDLSELEVESNFHIYRTRLNSEEDNWLGLRRDVLRRTENSYQIADRKIFLDQTLVLSRNLSSFF